MAAHRPLVRAGGRSVQLPFGDTVFGWGGTTLPGIGNLNSLDTPAGVYLAVSGTDSGTYPPAAILRGIVVVMRADTGGTVVMRQEFFVASLSGADVAKFTRVGVTALGFSSWSQEWNNQSFDPDDYAALAGAIFSGPVTMPNNSKIKGTASGAANLAYLGFYDVDNVRIGYVGDAGGSDSDMRLLADLGNLRLTGGGVQAVLSATGLTVGGDQVLLDDDTGWLTPTLLNGWTNVSGRALRYRKEGDEVRFRGATQNTTFANNNTAAMNAPSGFRPGQICVLPAGGGGFLVGPASVYCANISTGALIANDATTASGTVTVCWDNVRYSVN